MKQKEPTHLIDLVDEEPETEYCYFCGGIQPIVIPEELESEEFE